MQKSVINFTAFRLTEDETRNFVEIFKSLDTNSDGDLTMEEIKKGIDKCNLGKKINPDELIEIFNEMDVDKNGLINFTEFISAMMDYEKYIKKEQLLECFKSYDTDCSGKISFNEFCDMIKPQNEREKKIYIFYIRNLTLIMMVKLILKNLLRDLIIYVNKKLLISFFCKLIMI